MAHTFPFPPTNNKRSTIILQFLPNFFHSNFLLQHFTLIHRILQIPNCQLSIQTSEHRHVFWICVGSETGTWNSAFAVVFTWMDGLFMVSRSRYYESVSHSINADGIQFFVEDTRERLSEMMAAEFLICVGVCCHVSFYYYYYYSYLIC